MERKDIFVLALLIVNTLVLGVAMLMADKFYDFVDRVGVSKNLFSAWMIAVGVVLLATFALIFWLLLRKKEVLPEQKRELPQIDKKLEEDRLKFEYEMRIRPDQPRVIQRSPPPPVVERVVERYIPQPQEEYYEQPYEGEQQYYQENVTALPQEYSDNIFGYPEEQQEELPDGLDKEAMRKFTEATESFLRSHNGY